MIEYKKGRDKVDDPSLEAILPLYRDGVAGNEAAVQEAHRLFEQLRKKKPAFPLADAYHGSIMILIARDTAKPLEKLRWSKAGLKLLDQAVVAEPNNAMIRLIRGKATNKLPENHFHRTATAIEDFTFLVELQERQEVTFEESEYAQLLLDLGDAYRRIGRNGDAAACWRKLESRTNDPEFRSLLNERLQSLEGRPEVEDVPSGGGGASSILFGVFAEATSQALQTWAESQRKKEEEARRKAKRRKKKKKK